MSGDPYRPVVVKDLEPLLLRMEDAQHLLGGISLGKVKGLQQRGEIGMVRIGRRCLYTVDSIQAYLARQKAADQ